MALSIRDKLFITFTNGDTRRGRVTRRVPWARPHRVADRRQRMDERERAREGGRADARCVAARPPRRLSKPIFGISFGKHNVLRTLFMGSIRNLSPGDPALHSHTKGERRHHTMLQPIHQSESSIPSPSGTSAYRIPRP